MPEDTLAVSPDDVRSVLEGSGVVPRVALVLGSGLGGLAARISASARMPFSDFVDFPQPVSGVRGHAGDLIIGTLVGVPVVAFLGRVHMYQGLSALDAAWTARFASALGAEALVVTNAAGGIDPDLRSGEICLIADHINLTGDNPLVGWTGPEGGTPFVPMADAYDPELKELARDSAAALGMSLTQVVYAGLLGPSYETPAEVEYLRRTGAQAVGMSTVAEVVAARALGMRVLGLSLITNVAGGAHLSHDDVLAVGRRAEDALSDLVAAVVAKVG